MSSTICKNKDTKIAVEVMDYWTEERIANATPKPMPEPPETDFFVDLPEPKNPVVTPPNTSIYDEDIDQELALALANPVQHPNTFPWRCNGKLYFTWRGKDWVGSAGSISLEVLLTAAHNIYDDGEWSDNFYFCPAYPDNKKRWGWSRVAIFTAWQTQADFAYDYAMLLTDSSMKSIGSVGVVRDLKPEGRTWTAIGYPAKPPYDGQSMQKTIGSCIGFNNNIMTMDNNDMTQGSSGGNWLTNIKGENYVNGVQSTRGGAPSYANSPYIANKDYKKLLKCIKDGACD